MNWKQLLMDTIVKTKHSEVMASDSICSSSTFQIMVWEGYSVIIRNMTLKGINIEYKK